MIDDSALVTLAFQGDRAVECTVPVLAKTLALIFLLPIGVSAECEQAVPDGHPASEAKAMFGWFDSLGLDNVFCGKLVSIRYRYRGSSDEGRFSEPEYVDLLNRRPRRTESSCFLHSSKEDMPRTRTLRRLSTRRWLPRPMYVTGSSFKFAQLRSIWRRSRTRPTFDTNGQVRSARPSVLSRIAALHGLDSLSVQFYDLAKRESFEVYGDEPSGFEGRVKYDIGEVLVDEANLSLNSPDVSTSEALARLEVVSRRLPESSVRRRAQADADALGRLVESGKNRRPLSDAERKKLPVPDQIAELIWDLKDQTLRGSIGFEMPILFDTFEQSTHNSPADKLYRFGFAAVPALIEALRDTRAIKATNPSYRMVVHDPLHVQDVALQILRQIGGREFASSSLTLPRPFVDPLPADSAVASAPDESIEPIVSAAKAWWESARTLGEKEYMVRAMANGSPNSASIAQNMVIRYPEDAPEAIEKAVLSSSDAKTQVQFLSCLESLKTDATNRVAQRLMREGANLSVRLKAAEIINHSDPNAATAAMIVESTVPTKFLQDIDLTDSLVRFLLQSGKIEAIKSVATIYKAEIPKNQCQLAMTIDGWWCDDFANSRGKMSANDAAQASRSLEGVFAASLMAKAPIFHEQFNFGNDICENPRPCDIASWILARLYPSKYRGEWLASELRRDDRCASNLNIWRVSQNLPPLPVRSSLAIALLSPAALNTVISVLVENIPADATKLASIAQNAKGKTLSADGLIDLIHQMLDACDGRSRSGRLYLTRDIDGIKLSLNLGVLDPDNTGVSGSADTHTWTANISAVVSGTSSSGDGSISADVFNEIHKALAAPIEIPIDIELTIYGKVNHRRL